MVRGETQKDPDRKSHLTSYYLVAGRYYPLIAGNNQPYQLLVATTGYYLSNGG
jgi:hypothetical protein